MPTSIRRIVRISAAALSALLIMMVGACGGDRGDGQDGAPSRTAPPAPRPALTKQEAKAVLARFVARSTRVQARLDGRSASVVFMGSSLEMEIAKYRVFRGNKMRIKPARYGPVLGASPRFSGHPRWFFAAMTNRGSRPPVRKIAVFVQERAGGPWRAAYTPLALEPVKGPLARGVDVVDYPDVVAPGDPSLVMAPAQVSTAFADVLNRGSKSPHLRSFVIAPWAKTKYRNLRTDRKVFRRNGWAGTAGYRASRFPVYAVRTTSGGALVWSAVELKEDFRHTRRGNGIVWEYQGWGDLLRPFTGRSILNRTLASLERIEILAYVPPRGRGRIKLLANRWAPVAIHGR